MRPNSSNLKGLRVQTEYSPITGLPTSVTNTFVPSFAQVHNCAALVRGDFKSPNPWSYNGQATSEMIGWARIWSRSNPKSQTRFDGVISSSSSAPPWFDWNPALNACYEQALAKLTEKVRGSLDLATSLAETGQTVKMADLVSRFMSGVTDMQRSYRREVGKKLRATRGRSNLARDLRRWQNGLASRHPGAYRPVPLNPGLASRASSLGANGWCEFTYGWMPLISDIHGIAENICGFVRNNDVIKVSCTQQVTSRRSSTLLIHGANWVIPVYDEVKGFVRVQYGIRLMPGYDEGLAKWSSLNPLSVAWELVPYSFVVDWFLDIGSYMRNLETALLYGNKFRDGWYSAIAIQYIQRTAKPTVHSVGPDDTLTNAQASSRYYSYGRALLTSYPTPRLPSFQVALGANRLISAAALLRQLLK